MLLSEFGTEMKSKEDFKTYMSLETSASTNIFFAASDR